MKRVVIESPYAGDIAANIAYAKCCIRDSLQRDEAPLASHLLYTQQGILNDSIEEQRNLGISAGHAWIQHADMLAVYLDRGCSTGMVRGIEAALAYNIPIELRALDFRRQSVIDLFGIIIAVAPTLLESLYRNLIDQLPPGCELQ